MDISNFLKCFHSFLGGAGGSMFFIFLQRKLLRQIPEYSVRQSGEVSGDAPGLRLHHCDLLEINHLPDYFSSQWTKVGHDVIKMDSTRHGNNGNNSIFVDFSVSI